MRTAKLRLIRTVALAVALGLAVFSPLLGAHSPEVASGDANMPTQPPRAAGFDRPRPEIRVEQFLKLDEFTGFDRDLASVLKGSRERHTADGSRPGQGSEPLQVASLSREGRGGDAR